MRVVQFIWKMSLADGGVVRAVLDLCPLLAQPAPTGAGMDVELLCCVDDDVPAEWPAKEPLPGVPRVTVIERPASGKTLSSAALRVAAERIAVADVVHIHGMWVRCNTQIAKLCQRLGKPYVWSPHGMLDDWCMAQRSIRKRVFLAMVGRGLLERAAVVHCATESELSQAIKWFPRGRGMIAGLPLDLGPLLSGPGPEMARYAFTIDPMQGPLVLSIGRLSPKKGVHLLLQAVQVLRSRGERVQLIIAGTPTPGDEPYEQLLRETIAQHDAQSWAKMIGFVSGSTKTSLLQAADLVCLPTEQENFGYAVFEALAAGAPLLTTRGVAVWSTLRSERAAVILDALTPISIADAVAKILSDDAAGREMGQRGRAWVSKTCAPEAVRSGFEALYSAARGEAPPLSTSSRAFDPPRSVESTG